MKILVTGFDPFDKNEINPALEAIKKLPNSLSGIEIVTVEIPTVFNKSVKIIEEVIEREKPTHILSIGQAGGRSELTPERIAINLDDARIPDNEGNQPIDKKIVLNGPNAYFSQLPIKAMHHYMQRENIAASVSNTAGTFVCNHLMYQTLHLTNTKFSKIKAGFMHIPFLPEQVKDSPEQAFLPLEDIIQGIKLSILAIIDFNGKADLKMIAGKNH
ncbi:MAG: pyroglutamyl-peptidase I [Atopostipes suicloacalis]|nr:pyroglutamyl-peptidase I [Atopostipes suicloacalis]